MSDTTRAGATDSFGFVAGQINVFKASGEKFRLTRGPGNDLAGQLVGPNDDVRLRELR